MFQLKNKGSQIEQYNYLSFLKHTNETLFYYLLTHHLEELTPLVYTPTVRAVSPSSFSLAHQVACPHVSRWAKVVRNLVIILFLQRVVDSFLTLVVGN